MWSGWLAPDIKREFHWDNQTFALLIISFRVAYSIGQSASGSGTFDGEVSVRAA